MTESTSIRTRNYLTLPNGVPAQTRVLYNGISMLDWVRKSNFPKVFKNLGVRKIAKFKLSHDLLVWYYNKMFSFIMKEIIENDSVFQGKKLRLMIKSYRIKPKMIPDLFASDFKYRVPVLMIGSQVYPCWSTCEVVEYINTPDNYLSTTPSVITPVQINELMRDQLPHLTAKTINNLTQLSIWMLKTGAKNGLHGSVPYLKSSLVISDTFYNLNQKESEFYKNHRIEKISDQVFNRFLTHVKRNYK